MSEVTDLTLELMIISSQHVISGRYFSPPAEKRHFRANPGSEFVVANTLAKWKKLELSEFDFSQGFSQKVVLRSCSVFNSLPASRDYINLCKQFGAR